MLSLPLRNKIYLSNDCQIKNFNCGLKAHILKALRVVILQQKNWRRRRHKKKTAANS